MMTNKEHKAMLEMPRDEYLTKVAFSRDMARAKVMGHYGSGEKTKLYQDVYFKCVKFVNAHVDKNGPDSAHIELIGGIRTMNFSQFPSHRKLLKWARKQKWYMLFIKQQKTSILNEDKYADALCKYMKERQMI